MPPRFQTKCSFSFNTFPKALSLLTSFSPSLTASVLLFCFSLYSHHSRCWFHRSVCFPYPCCSIYHFSSLLPSVCVLPPLLWLSVAASLSFLHLADVLSHCLLLFPSGWFLFHYCTLFSSYCGNILHVVKTELICRCTHSLSTCTNTNTAWGCISEDMFTFFVNLHSIKVPVKETTSDLKSFSASWLQKPCFHF